MRSAWFRTERSSRRVQIPQRQPQFALEPDAAADRPEGARQLAAIPGARAQAGDAVGAGLIAVVAPVFERERAEVERTPAHPCEVRDSTLRLLRRQVLQHVVTDPQIETFAQPQRRHRTLAPAVAATQILAEFESDVLRLRQRALQRRAQQADAAADIENLLHRQADILHTSCSLARPR